MWSIGDAAPKRDYLVTELERLRAEVRESSSR